MEKEEHVNVNDFIWTEYLGKGIQREWFDMFDELIGMPLFLRKLSPYEQEEFHKKLNDKEKTAMYLKWTCSDRAVSDMLEVKKTRGLFNGMKEEVGGEMVQSTFESILNRSVDLFLQQNEERMLEELREKYSRNCIFQFFVLKFGAKRFFEDHREEILQHISTYVENYLKSDIFKAELSSWTEKMALGYCGRRRLRKSLNDAIARQNKLFEEAVKTAFNSYDISSPVHSTIDRLIIGKITYTQFITAKVRSLWVGFRSLKFYKLYRNLMVVLLIAGSLGLFFFWSLFQWILHFIFPQ